MGAKEVVICLPSGKSAKIIKWKVEEGNIVYEGRVLLLYNLNTDDGAGDIKKLKASEVGTVRKLLVKEGENVEPGAPLMELERGCSHPTVMNDLCAECGADLRREETQMQCASVPMIHSIPDLKVSEAEAKILGRADKIRLLEERKLVLLVDLDQTLIHTTNDNIPNNLKDVYHFQLHGPKSRWFHTRLRPGTHQFLTEISKYYELHICTFGARNYAHMIAHFLDPEGKFFSQRILSRDECFDPNSKVANLKALFPCGDDLVCIIDDREDVWSFVPNLIHVKPYHFFRHTGDIHAPPGLTKCENDDMEASFDFSQFAKGTKVKCKIPFKKVKEEKVKYELEEGELKSGESTMSESELEIGDQEDKIIKPDLIDNNLSDIKDNVVEHSSLKITNENLISVGEDDIKNIDASLNKVSDDNLDENIEKHLIDSVKEKFGHQTDLREKIENLTGDDDIKGNCEDKNSEYKNKENSEDKTKENCEDINKENSDDINKENSDDKNKENCEDKNKENSQDKIKENSEDKNKDFVNKIHLKDESELCGNYNSTDINGKPEQNSEDKNGDDLLEVEESDDYLLYLEEILKMIHRQFYTTYDSKENNCAADIPKSDLKHVIPDLRKKVLAGVRLVFSGLVPTNASLEQSKAYFIAKSLGAEVVQEVDKDVTHLIAVRTGTAKFNSVKKIKSIKIVTPDWLWSCAERWERVEESLFPLTFEKTSSRIPPPHCFSPTHVSSTPNISTIPAPRQRSPSGRFMDTINPLMSFSSEDIADMDAEVEDICNESESESENKETVERTICQKRTKNKSNRDSSSSSDDSQSDSEERWGRKRQKTSPETEDEESLNTIFRRGEKLPSDVEFDENSGASAGSDDAPDEISDGDWNMMGAALEREFLEGD